MAGMLAQVRAKADVVIRNPTHLACALHYMPDGRGSPPKLIGKGKGWLAEQLVRAAREEGIPMLHDVPLARSLFRLEQDAFIPPELYEAVIEVLHWAEEVAEQRGRKVRWKEAADVLEPRLADAAAPSLPDDPPPPMASNVAPPLGDEPLPSLKPSIRDPRPPSQATRPRDQR